MLRRPNTVNCQLKPLREHIFDLSISIEEYEKVYRGSARHVLATSREGLVVQFPADILRRYLTRTGIHGSFAVMVDDQDRFQGVRLL